MTTPDAIPDLLPSSHHGAWRGPNRLWMMDPENPFRSDGEAEVEGHAIRYTWEHEGAKKTGIMELSGPAHALEAHWTDTFHAAEGMVLHGCMRDGRLILYGTYPAGEYGVWGWQVELDVQDRERFFIRMHNVMPGRDPVPAVVFEGGRA